MADLVTKLHYAPNSNVVNGVYAPGADGFNLADISSAAEAETLQAGVLGLVWLGDTSGVTPSFMSTVNAAVGDPKVYGFFLADEPGPDVSAANLKAEADYIHSVDPRAITFITLYNNGTPTNPSYSFNSANTDIDLFGLDPYPVRPWFTNGVDYSVIGDAVNAAEAEGIPQSALVPVYQAFGGGQYTSYTLPTPAQEQTILSTWGQYLPKPAFDMAYSWGIQDGDTALVDDPSLQAGTCRAQCRNWNATTSSGCAYITSDYDQCHSRPVILGHRGDFHRQQCIDTGERANSNYQLG